MSVVASIKIGEATIPEGKKWVTGDGAPHDLRPHNAILPSSFVLNHASNELYVQQQHINFLMTWRQSKDMAATFRPTTFTLLKRREGITREAFNEHWHTTHAKIISSQPEFWKNNETYVQNHLLTWPQQMQARENKIFDGVVKSYQRIQEGDEILDYFDEPSYLTRTRPDEERFLEYEASTTVYCEERIIKDGPTTGIKLLNFLRPLDGMDLATFSDYWLHHHAKAVQSVDPFWKKVRRYAQYHVRPHLFRGSSVVPSSEQFTGVAELCFDSIEDYEEAVRAPDIPTRLRPDENVFIKEHTMFLVKEIPVKRPADKSR